MIHHTKSSTELQKQFPSKGRLKSKATLPILTSKGNIGRKIPIQKAYNIFNFNMFFPLLQPAYLHAIPI